MVSAVFSGSASPNTTTGEWPPSSMVARFMPFAASAGEMLADRHRAGERNLAHHVGRDQMLRDVRRHAEHEVEHARRHAGIDEAAHQLDAASRRLLRRLDDDRAAGRQRGADLARRRQRREIPRREGGDHADRLLHHELAHALGAARHDAAVGAAALLGEPFDDVGGDQHLAARLGEDLALLLRHDAGDVVRRARARGSRPCAAPWRDRRRRSRARPRSPSRRRRAPASRSAVAGMRQPRQRLSRSPD